MSAEQHVYPPPAAAVKNAWVSGMDGYQALVDEAERDHEAYWARLAKELISWRTPFKTVLDADSRRSSAGSTTARSTPRTTASTATSRPASATRRRSSSRPTTARSPGSRYQELLARTCRLANALKARGVVKGDRVVIYMPMSIEGVVAMQACARIGATHSVVFGGFSAQSLRDRIADTGAVLVITADEQMRGGKALPLKAIVDEALDRPRTWRFAMSSSTGAPAARSTSSRRATSGCTSWSTRSRRRCEPEWVRAEHPLFLLYTSGSTGKPKGVQHSTGGYLLHAALTTKWTFDLKPDDVFWCTADIGWVTGHTYIAYGPLALGGTEIVFEGIPTYPDAGRFWKMIAKHKVIDLLHRADGDPLADQGRRGQREGRTRRTTTCRACASSARSASRSTRPPGSGTTSTSAAAAARSSTPSGRPRPAAT